MTSKRKLVFLNPIGGSALGGGEMVAAEVIKGLAERGWDITLLSPADSGLTSVCKAIQGVRVEPVDFADFSFNTLRKLYQFSRNYREAIWYGNTYRALKWLAFARMAGDMPVVCHLHESYYAQYYFKRTRFLAPYIDRFICISETVRHEIIRGTGRASLPAVTIYNGSLVGKKSSKTDEEKHSLRKELGLPLQKPLVCLPGRSDPLKGHEVFMVAAAQLKQPAFFLVVGGNWGLASETEYEVKMKARCAGLGMSDRFIFVPHTNRVRDYMRCADLVVIPSLSEGFGRVAVEAMMEQTPLIASNVGGLGEIIRDQSDGLLVQPEDADKLAHAMHKMLGDDLLQQRMVINAYERALSCFSHTSMLDQIERELKMVTENQAH